VANTKASNTTYYIVAGDITNYQASGGWFKRFVEKIEVGIGKVVYYNIPNDIAVGVEDIQKVNGVDKDTHTAVVPGHHLNYFENPPSVEKWKEWL
jgi:chorismate synthase